MYFQTTKKNMEDELPQQQHVRQPDEPRRETLLPSINDYMNHNDNIMNNNYENIQDTDMKQAIENSMSSFENEYMLQCQDHVLEHDIQMMLQQEHDNKLEERKQREFNLGDLVVRLKIIDKERKYLNLVSSYIETGQPMSYDHFVEIIEFVRKPKLVSMITQYICYEK